MAASTTLTFNSLRQLFVYHREQLFKINKSFCFFEIYKNMDQSAEIKNQTSDEKREVEEQVATIEKPHTKTVNESEGNTRPENGSPQTSEQRTAKKRASAEKPQVYGYVKKKIVDYLEENGCSSKSVGTVIAASKFNKSDILEYLNERMQLAHENVHEECESMSFNNIQSWLEQFKKWNLPELCLYEPALVINAIANNEAMIEANEFDGVDLRSVYKFLGNALLGLPQTKLSEKSAEFLTREFEILVDEANTDKGDEQTVVLNNRLQTYKELPCNVQKEKSSIDPLCLNTDFKF